MHVIENLKSFFGIHVGGEHGPALKRAKAFMRRSAGTPVPASLYQEQLWMHAQLAPDLPLYNEAVTIIRKGPLNAVAVEKSLTEIIRRQGAWRTNFAVLGG